MPRFFLDKSAISGDTVTIDGKNASHISLSLRMAPGEEITVCSEDGEEYLCRLESFTPDTVTAKIVSHAPSHAEMPVRVHLYQAFPKGDKLEVIVQKSVEEGVYDVTPFESDRCIKRPHAEKIPKMLDRLSKISEEAAKQSGRGMIPKICSPLKFADMLRDASRFPLVLFCYEGSGVRSLKDILEGGDTPSDIAVIIGSEGGFSQAEAECARSAGFEMTGLGARILRCETAASHTLACLSYRYEL